MNRIELNGAWQCSFPDGQHLEVMVPGCFDVYRKEKDIADAVTLSRTFCAEIGEGKRALLYFGGVSYYCDIYVNGRLAGSHEGMWDNFSTDVSGLLKNGENELTLTVWKPGYHKEDRFPLREVLSGFIPDVLCTFGGIWDDVYLLSADTYFIGRHCASASLDGAGKLTVDINCADQIPVKITGAVYGPDGRKAAAICAQREAGPGENRLEIPFELSEPDCWSPNRPQMYRYDLEITAGGQTERVENAFGCRSIQADDSRILLNGEPVYPRGILHWGYYSGLTPRPGAGVIRDEIAKCRQYGFNMIKHCLYIPREEYLRQADEAVMLLWIELPLWLPDVSEELEPRILREFPRLLNQIKGHPSVVMASLGCELDDKVGGAVLEEMYRLAKRELNCLVRDNSGSGECYGGLAVDYADFSDYHFYGELQNMENLMENFTPVWKRNRPWIYGEFCDSDTMRDLAEVRGRMGKEELFWEKADPVENPISILKPDFYLGSHEERMKESGIRTDFSLIKELSFNHSMVHRKTTLEETRAFEEISGYNITSIRDVPIATSGIFDDFMEPKFDRKLFCSFNSDVMLIPAWDLGRTWIGADRVLPRERYNFIGGSTLTRHILVSNYSGSALVDPVLSWSLETDGHAWAGGKETGRTVLSGTVRQCAYLSFALPKAGRPSTAVLKVKLSCGAVECENRWPVFLYPELSCADVRVGLYDPCHIFDRTEPLFQSMTRIADEQEIALDEIDAVLTSRLTPAVLRYVERGGKAVCVQRGTGPLPTVPVAFWREGMVRYGSHPALGGIRYENWMDDLRFFGVGTDTSLDLTDPYYSHFTSAEPVILRYDCREWKKSAYMAELRLGRGRILATTLRLEGGMGKQPLFITNNTLGRHLLMSAVLDLTGRNGGQAF